MRLKWVLWVLIVLMGTAFAAADDEEVSIYTVLPAEPAQGAVPAPEASPEPTEAVAQEATAAPEADPAAREEFIDRMLALAQTLAEQAGNRPQRAHYAGDIYVCKNFTVHIFRENSADYKIAAYPDARLVIPNNLSRDKSRPHAYGIAWEDIPAQQGNPFYAAHAFYYDANLSKEENRQLALAFMREVKKGDFFQMSANYQYGVGAHSAVFTADYDPDTNRVAWTDSNMNGVKRNGERYGYVQFGAQKDIGWFVDAFCQRTRGATLYRLRDDIVRR